MPLVRHLFTWIERIPEGTQQNDGVETGTVRGCGHEMSVAEQALIGSPCGAVLTMPRSSKTECVHREHCNGVTATVKIRFRAVAGPGMLNNIPGPITVECTPWRVSVYIKSVMCVPRAVA